VVAVGAPAGMPARPFSAAIVGGLWPNSDPGSWSDVADGLRSKASELEDQASSIRKAAYGLYSDNSGHMIDGMVEMYGRDAVAVLEKSEMYHTMSDVVDEVAQLIYHLRSQLDEIDRAANEEIQRLKANAPKRGIGAAAAAGEIVNKIAQVVAQARSRAEAASAATAAKIASEGARIGSDPAASMPPDGSGASNGVPPLAVQPAGFGGRPGPGGMPQGTLPGQIPEEGPGRPVPAQTPAGDRPQQPVTAGAGSSDGGRPQQGDQPGPGQPGGNPTPSVPVANSGSRTTPGTDRPDTPNGPLPQLPQTILPPVGPVASPPGSGGVPLEAAGGGSGFKMPSTGMPTGMGMSTGSVAPLNPSLGSPTAGAGLTPPPPTSLAPPAAATDFSRGLNAGLGATGGGPPAAPLLPPPAALPPPSAVGPASGVPAAGSDFGPLSAASGPPAATSISAPAAASTGGATMPPPTPPGMLPPFGSDVPPRPVASVTPASAPPPPAPTPAVSPVAPTPPVTPLPPGVVGSGVGATAAGAYGGVRSTRPDPLLESASQLVYQLMHASRVYGCLDWCVGIFKTTSGMQTVVVTNEGAGYIPAGVFIPRSARMLFSDPSLSNDFQARWFHWVNPAQTMLAYAALCAESDPNVELHAVAVSTDHGGSALPARGGGVPHYEDCSLILSPIKPDAPAAPLDESRMHRLETIDLAEYGRLTGIGGGRPDRRQAWATTQAAVRSVLARAASLLGLSVPPIVRYVLQTLSDGEEFTAHTLHRDVGNLQAHRGSNAPAITEAQWEELNVARLNAILDSASQRPGRMAEGDGASPYARAYHNLARAAEMLGMWHGGEPQYAEIAYLAAQIHKETQLWPHGTE
jgi:hypothetical protein